MLQKPPETFPKRGLQKTEYVYKFLDRTHEWRALIY